jgi:hypothetical protein
MLNKQFNGNTGSYSTNRNIELDCQSCRTQMLKEVKEALEKEMLFEYKSIKTGTVKKCISELPYEVWKEFWDKGELNNGDTISVILLS